MNGNDYYLRNATTGDKFETFAYSLMEAKQIASMSTDSCPEEWLQI